MNEELKNSDLSVLIGYKIDEFLETLNCSEMAKNCNLYGMTLNLVEKVLLDKVLNYTKNNKTQAAQILGITRSTLRKRLLVLKIENS